MPLLQVAVSSSELVTTLLVLASSDTNEVQVLSAQCLARFAAWQGVAQQAICNISSAEVMTRPAFLQSHSCPADSSEVCLLPCSPCGNHALSTPSQQLVHPRCVFCLLVLNRLIKAYLTCLFTCTPPVLMT